MVAQNAAKAIYKGRHTGTVFKRVNLVSLYQTKGVLSMQNVQNALVKVLNASGLTRTICLCGLGPTLVK